MQQEDDALTKSNKVPFDINLEGDILCDLQPKTGFKKSNAVPFNIVLGENIVAAAEPEIELKKGNETPFSIALYENIVDVAHAENRLKKSNEVPFDIELGDKRVGDMQSEDTRYHEKEVSVYISKTNVLGEGADAKNKMDEVIKDIFNKKSEADMLKFIDEKTRNHLSKRDNNERKMSSFKYGILGELYRIKPDGKEEQVANYHIEIKNKLTIVSEQGKKIKLVLQAIKFDEVEEVSIELDQFDSLYEIVGRLNPDFYLNYEYRSAVAHFKLYIHEVYTKMKDRIPNKFEYDLIGWYKNENQKWEYISHHLPQCVSINNRKLANLLGSNLYSICEWGFGVLDIGKNLNNILPIWLYMFYGFTIPLLKDAGFTPQLIFMIRGRSGSLKTALGRVLFNLFEVADGLNFQSTKVAIENSLMESKDTNFLLDDIFNSSDKASTQLFYQILRCVADGIGRKKFDVKTGGDFQYKYRSGLVVTAEAPLEDQLSSRLRYIVCPIEQNSFDGDRLKLYQEDIANARRNKQDSGLEKFISAYIFFIQAHYDNLLATLIQWKTANMRLVFKEKRLNNAYECYGALSMLVMAFAKSCGYNPAIGIDECDQCIKALIQENEFEASVVDDYKIWLELINEGMCTGSFGIAESMTEYTASKGAFYGYKSDHDQIVLNPNTSFIYVEVEARRRYKNNVALSASVIESKLDELGVVVGIDENCNSKIRRRHKKRISIEGKQVWMLVVRIDVFNEIIKKLHEE